MSMQRFQPGACGLCILGVLFSASQTVFAQQSRPKSIRVYVGGGGLQFFELDPATGKPSEPKAIEGARGVGFLAISPDHKYLYTTSGGVTAYRIDPQSGMLTQLNSQPSEGTSTAHVSVDHAGKNVLAVNYDSGVAVICFPLNADGSLKPRSDAESHTGSSVNPMRQRGPHPHSVNISADDRFAVVADLGIDKLMVYRFDSAAGRLDPNDPPSVSTKPGAGPRHFCFHPNGKFAYNNNEIDMTATAYSYDAQKGVLTPLNTLTTLPENTPSSDRYSTAETLVHPSGKFVYVSNRGHNTIAVFRINEDGTIKAAGHQSTQGEIPRSFGIDPTGHFLLAANQDSNNVVVFRINQETGALQPTGDVVATARRPICVRMYAVE